MAGRFCHVPGNLLGSNIRNSGDTMRNYEHLKEIAKVLLSCHTRNRPIFFYYCINYLYLEIFWSFKFAIKIVIKRGTFACQMESPGPLNLGFCFLLPPLPKITWKEGCK